MDFSHVQTWIEAFSYPAVFGLLVAAGFGAPLSEDVIMLAGGLVTAKTHGSLLGMMLTAYVGVLLGDSSLFHIGRKLGSRAVGSRFVQKVLTPKRLQWAQQHFAKSGFLTVFTARFLIGFRAVTFVSAGTTGMPYRRFLVADALAAALFVPTLVFVGFKFGAAAADDVKSALVWILAGVVTLVVVVSVVQALRRRAQLARLKAQSEQTTL